MGTRQLPVSTLLLADLVLSALKIAEQALVAFYLAILEGIHKPLT